MKQSVADRIAQEPEVNIYGKGGYTNKQEYIAIQTQAKFDEMKAEIDDLQAVENVLLILDKQGKRGIIKAIKIVYFADANKPFERGDIARRVHKAEIEIPASEQAVYNWLREAGHLFCIERGLRY